MSSPDQPFDPIARTRELLIGGDAAAAGTQTATTPTAAAAPATFDAAARTREILAEQREEERKRAATIAAGRISATEGFDTEAARLAEGLRAETGKIVPVPLVAADKARFGVELEQAKIIKAFTDAPLTARWFAEAENSAYARRDAEYLAFLEKTLRDPSMVQTFAAPALGAGQAAVDTFAGAARGVAVGAEATERAGRQRNLAAFIVGFTRIQAYEAETGEPATAMRAAFARRLRQQAVAGNAPLDEFRALEAAAAAVEAGGSPDAALAALRQVEEAVVPAADRALYRSGEWITRNISPYLAPAPGTEDNLSVMFGQGIGSMAAFMGTSALTGVVGSFTVATATGVDEAYQRARSAGISHEEAIGYAAQGAPAGFIQAISVEFLMRRLPIPARNRMSVLVRDIAATAGAEAAVESLGAVMQNAIEQQYNASQGLFEGTLMQGLIAGSAAATLRGLMLAFAPGARRTLWRDIERMERSGEIEKTFKALSEGVQASEMRTQVPERFRAWAQTVTTGTPAETVYVSAEGVQTLAQSVQDPALLKRVVDALPGVTQEAFQQAVENRTDLAIPMSTWMTDVIGSEIDALLLPHVRLDPTQMTTFERKANAAEIAKEVESLRERASAIARGEEQAPLSPEEEARVAVFDDIVGKLGAAGIERSTAEAYAAQYAAFYARQSARAGIDIAEFLRRYPTANVMIEGTEVSMRPVPANPRMTFADLLTDIRAGADNEFARAGLQQLREMGLEPAAMTDEEIIDALELRDTLRQAEADVAPGSTAMGRLMGSTALNAVPFPQGPVFNGEGPSVMARPTTVDRVSDSLDVLYQQEIDDAATWRASLAKARTRPVGFVSLGRTPLTVLFSGGQKLPLVMGSSKIAIVEGARADNVFPPGLMENLRTLLIDPLAIIEQRGGERDSDLLVVLDARTVDGQFIAVAIKKGEVLDTREFKGRVNMIRTVMPVPAEQMAKIAIGRGARAVGVRYVRDNAAVSTLALADPDGPNAEGRLLRYEQGVAYSGERKVGRKADLVNSGLTLYQQEVDIDRLPGLENASPGRVRGVRELATRYMISRGLPVRHQAEYVKVDVTRAKIIARLYDEAVDSPNDPTVRAAYEALAEETLAQYEALLELGFTFDWITGEDPYASPADAIRDMQENKHLWVFPTESGFGTNTEASRDHPLLRTTQYEIGGRTALVNDIFRIVHDVFGHGSEGASFGPRGEENAWQAHVRMFSPLAARAMTSETRGQNSWVNYGPYGEANRKNPKSTVFADQKTVLLPAWVSQVGQAADVATAAAAEEVLPEGTLMQNGQPVTFYHGTQATFAQFRDGRTFFTNRKALATEHALRMGASGTPRVVTAHLALQNPLEIDAGAEDTDVFWLQNTSTIERDWEIGGHDGVIISNSAGDAIVITAGSAPIYRTDLPKVDLETPVEAADLNRLTADFFRRPGWVIFSATRGDLGAWDSAENIGAAMKAREWLERNGTPYVEVKGRYGGVDDGPSFLIIERDPRAPARIARRFGQESVLTRDGFVGADANFSPVPSTGEVRFGKPEDLGDNFSILPDGRAFSVELDFDYKTTISRIKPGFSRAAERPQLPIRPDGKVELFHWSDKELTVVDPKKAGTGPLRGPEQRRGAEMSFYGINPRESTREEGTGYVKEAGLGVFLHKVAVDPDRLYPWFEDPDGLKLRLAPGDRNNVTAYEKLIREAGYIGYYVTEDGAGSAPLGNVAALFEAVEVESVVDETAGQVLYQSENTRWYYSALTRAAEQAKQAKAPAKDWVTILANTPGVRKDEIMWTGVIDWLATREGQVTREELTTFLRGQELDLLTNIGTEKGRPRDGDGEFDFREIDSGPAELDYDYISERAEEEIDDVFDDMRQELEDELRDDLSSVDDDFATNFPDADFDTAISELIEEMVKNRSLDDASENDLSPPAEWLFDYTSIRMFSRMAMRVKDRAEERATRWAEQDRGTVYTYEATFPDGSEETFTITYEPAAGEYYSFELGDSFSSINAIADAIRERYDDRFEYDDGEGADIGTRWGSYTETGGRNYREVLLRVPSLEETGPNDGRRTRADEFVNDTHFPQPNIVVHARIKDRLDNAKRRTLFVEEIQSDLASDLRKHYDEMSDQALSSLASELERPLRAETVGLDDYDARRLARAVTPIALKVLDGGEVSARDYAAIPILSEDFKPEIVRVAAAWLRDNPDQVELYKIASSADQPWRDADFMQRLEAARGAYEFAKRATQEALDAANAAPLDAEADLLSRVEAISAEVFDAMKRDNPELPDTIYEYTNVGAIMSRIRHAVWATRTEDGLAGAVARWRDRDAPLDRDSPASALPLMKDDFAQAVLDRMAELIPDTLARYRAQRAEQDRLTAHAETMRAARFRAETTLSRLQALEDTRRLPYTPFDSTIAYEVMLKRLLNLAAKEGYQSLAWTPGYMQAQRWSGAVQNVVQEVRWEARADNTPGRFVELRGTNGNDAMYLDPDGVIVEKMGGRIPAEQVEGRNIAELIGGPIARQIIAEDTGSLTGNQIVIGGDGYKISYDQTMKKFVEKWAKKFGGRVTSEVLPDFISTDNAGGVLRDMFGYADGADRVEALIRALGEALPDVTFPDGANLGETALRNVDLAIANERARIERDGEQTREEIARLNDDRATRQGLIDELAADPAYEAELDAATRWFDALIERATTLLSERFGTPPSRAAVEAAVLARAVSRSFAEAYTGTYLDDVVWPEGLDERVAAGLLDGWMPTDIGAVRADIAPALALRAGLVRFRGLADTTVAYPLVRRMYLNLFAQRTADEQLARALVLLGDTEANRRIASARAEALRTQATTVINVAASQPAGRAWLAANYPGMIVERPVWFVEITDKMREAALQPQPLFQKQRGKIVLPPKGQAPTITLLSGSDLSTFLHEAGHQYLYILQDLATQPDASEDIRRDWAVIRNWWRNNAAAVAADASATGTPVTDADVVNYIDNGSTGDGAKDRALGVGVQEQWARGMEAYLREGKSPSQALRRAFRKFKAWLVSIYRRAEDLNVNISPEMRDVFDRLFATEAEISEAREDTKFGTLTAKSAAELGVDDQTWARLLELQEEAAAEQEEILLREIMAPLRRQATEEFKREREATRQAVRAEVIAKPVQRLREWIGNARWLDGQAPADLPADIRIDRDTLVETYGEDILRTLPRGRYPLYSRMGERGLLPDEVAGWFGFSSGDAMVQALRSSANVDAEVKAETDARMKAKYPDPLQQPERIAAVALDALHGEKAGELLVAEMRALAKGGNVKGKVTPRQQAREVARRTIAGTKVREALRSHLWQGAERRAANDAAEALAKGDRQGAFDAKRRQLINHMLFSESRKAAELAGKLERLTGRLKRKGTRDNLAPDYLAAIDEILATYEFTRVSNRQLDRRGALRAFVDRMKEQGRENELAIPAEVLERAERVNYRDLTVEQLEGVFDALRNIEHIARFKKKLLDAQAQRELDAIVDEVLGAFDENLKRQPRGRVKTGADQRGRGLRQYLNLVLNASTILRRIDGQQDSGPAYRAIKSRIDAAQRRATQMQEELAEKLDQVYAAYTRTEMRRMAVKKRYEFANADLSRWDIISIALNMGNVDNLQRLTDPDSRGFTRLQVDKLVDELDKRDWEFVQGMIDLINSYWPLIAERETRLTGVPPKKVEALPIVTKFGTFPGGYYPIMYDGELSAQVTDEQSADLLRNVMPGKYGKAQTAAGHLETRKNGSGGRPLMIGIEVAHMHLARVTHDLAFSEAVSDSWRVLRDGRLRAAFQDYGMLDDLETLEVWVQDVASGSIGAGDVVSRMFRRLKSNFTLAKLGFNFATVAVQLTGISQSMVVVGKRNFAMAAAQYAKSPRGVVAEINAKSDLMRRRQTTFNKDIYDIVGEVTSGPVEGRYNYAMRRVIGPMAFLLMQKVQFFGVDVPTWLAAYNRASRAGLDEAAAVAEADAALVRAQAGGEWADRSAFERGTLNRGSRQSDITRLFTTLGSYMFAKMNVAYERTAKMKRTVQAEGVSGRSVAEVAGYTADMALLFTLEAILYAAIVGRLPDDEDDEDAGWTAFLLRETGLSAAAGLPFLRDLTGPLQGFSEGGAYGGITETMTSPIVRAMADGDGGTLRLTTVKSVINAVGLATGLPSTATNRILDGVWRSAEGDEVSPVEYLMGRR